MVHLFPSAQGGRGFRGAALSVASVVELPRELLEAGNAAAAAGSNGAAAAAAASAAPAAAGGGEPPKRPSARRS